MLKKIMGTLLILALSVSISVVPVINASAINSNPQETNTFSGQVLTPQLDKSMVVEGYIKIAYTNENVSKMKVLVEKDNNKYNYDFDGKGKYENYPLNMGDGEYNIYLLENTEGRNYMIIDEWNVNAKINTNNSLYTISNKMVNFENSNIIINKTNELVKGLKTDEDKAKAIYKYVVNNFKYDYKKYKILAVGYVPNVEEIMNSKSGICYDFATVYASMLRSAGIPTKLVMGNSKKILGYHAWNEVFINQKWVIVDTSYDSQATQLKAVVNMYKESSDYNKEKQY